MLEQTKEQRLQNPKSIMHFNSIRLGVSSVPDQCRKSEDHLMFHHGHKMVIDTIIITIPLLLFDFSPLI